MRVIHIAPTPFGTSGLLGGGERYPIELARALAHQVDCELISFGRKPASYREAGGLQVRILRSRMFMRGHPAHPIAPSLVGALSGADVIHTHHMRSLPSRLAAVVANVRRLPAVVTDHGLQGGNWVGLLPRLFRRFLMVSAYSAAEFRTPPGRTKIIYGGADPERFFPDPNYQRDGVLFVGRLTPHKGLDRLIPALPEKARLRVAGSTGHDPHLPERDYPLLLQRLAASHDVDFLGPVPDDELPELYRSASVLVLPSVHKTCYGRDIRVSELLGLVALEAMSSGTPVICSRLGGLPEIVQDGVTGFLVEPGNVKELRQRINQVLGDPQLATQLGRNARDQIVDRLTWQHCADRCLETYRDLTYSSL